MRFTRIGGVRGSLRRAFADAERLGYVYRNPIALTSPPSTEDSKRRQAFTAEEVRALLDVEDRLAPVWRLAFESGCRRGELCGLRDEDIDGTRIHIRRQRLVRPTRDWEQDRVYTRERTKSGRNRAVVGERRDGGGPLALAGSARPGAARVGSRVRRTPGGSAPSPTAPLSRRTPCRGGSTPWSAAPVSRTAGCTRRATAMPRWRWPAALDSTSCPASSGTRASRSPPTCTDTRTRRPRPRRRRSCPERSRGRDGRETGGIRGETGLGCRRRCPGSIPFVQVRWCRRGDLNPHDP